MRQLPSTTSSFSVLQRFGVTLVKPSGQSSYRDAARSKVSEGKLIGHLFSVPALNKAKSKGKDVHIFSGASSSRYSCGDPNGSRGEGHICLIVKCANRRTRGRREEFARHPSICNGAAFCASLVVLPQIHHFYLLRNVNPHRRDR
ncbi:hypothetical protein N7536_007270 [Penicillium majusculum]|nr:hypothetical protein N7536_007270 [Penicillium majusculum]